MKQLNLDDWSSVLKKIWGIQFVRFLVTGGVNALVGFSFYSALILSNLHYSLAILIAMIFGVIFNFKSYSYLVFNNKDNRIIIKFSSVYLVNYVCTTFFTWLLLHIIPNKIITGAVLILPMALLTFILNRKFVFAPVLSPDSDKFDKFIKGDDLY